MPPFLGHLPIPDHTGPGVFSHTFVLKTVQLEVDYFYVFTATPFRRTVRGARIFCAWLTPRVFCPPVPNTKWLCVCVCVCAGLVVCAWNRSKPLEDVPVLPCVCDFYSQPSRVPCVHWQPLADGWSKFDFQPETNVPYRCCSQQHNKTGQLLRSVLGKPHIYQARWRQRALANEHAFTTGPRSSVP